MSLALTLLNPDRPDRRHFAQLKYNVTLTIHPLFLHSPVAHLHYVLAFKTTHYLHVDRLS
jgi:hypothetical protein